MKREDSIFASPFLSRFSNRPVFFLLSVAFILGLLVGAIAVKAFSLSEIQFAFPAFFSGIPLPKAGFFNYFSSSLLNSLIFLILLFLFGVTAFGAVGIPLLLFFRAASIGIGVLSFLTGEGMEALAYPALCYAPMASAFALLLLLFGTRALLFSNHLAKAGFFQSQESLDFQLYFRDFLYFLSFLVLVSVCGAFFAWLFDNLL